MKDVEKFIDSLKDQLNKSRNKRKKLVDQLQEKETQCIDDELLRKKIEECEKLVRANVVQKNEIEFIVTRLTKEIKDEQ